MQWRIDMTREELDAYFQHVAEKRAAGICTVEGCREPINSGVLPRCKEHAGVFAGTYPPQVPAQPHRSRQAPYNRYGKK